MDLPVNRFKAALKEGRRQIGVWNTIPDPSVVELLAGCGYDWLLIDTEHSPATDVMTLPLMQAAAPYPVTQILRPGWNDPVEIKRLLDSGAQTVLVPYVQTAEEAAKAVAACHYPPKGMRGVSGLTRASRYGAIADYGPRAGEEICVLVQVETVAALDQIEEIAAVDGVDGIFVGPADLAASMDLMGQTAHPKVLEAVTGAIRRIRAAGKPAGVLSASDAFLRPCEEAGAVFIAVDIDVAMLRRAAVARREDWRD
ncbi:MULTISPECIES: HpcH/HpaI aldolase family protein [Ponticoccus]|uniref:HpcH/HpaI aldolase/citrate lyase family protein n=1 Tax=Ponticoccus litoralis TaxID=422297 RepID=A0AAW9SIG8_9RHOB